MPSSTNQRASLPNKVLVTCSIALLSILLVAMQSRHNDARNWMLLRKAFVSRSACHIRPHVSRSSPKKLVIPRSSVAADDKGVSTTSITSALQYLDKDTSPATYPVKDQIANLEKPGILDRAYFQFDESAEFWENFDPGEYEPPELVKKIQDSVETPQDAAYWAYNLGRFGFFLGTAALGTFYSGNQGTVPSDFASNIIKTRDKGLLKNLPNDSVNVHLWNLKWIKEGKFNMPYDMNIRHRQYDPRYILQKTRQSVQEMATILGKRYIGDKADTNIWFKDKIYPSYYQKTFHFQTDGWLSTESAEIYEHMTELIFFGKQDAMQRTTLVPFKEFIDNYDAGTPKVLEIAAGTGRFATFMKDSFPQIDLTVSELSPFYLEKARKNMKYYENFRKDNLATDSNPEGNLGPTHFVQAAAEDLPLPDASQDCVVSVYLFHELPPESRKKVVEEVARVLKPGGKFILTDSIQLGDRRQLDGGLDNFEKLNEPWYPSFLREDFGKLLTQDGLFRAEKKYICSVTKSLSFTRL